MFMFMLNSKWIPWLIKLYICNCSVREELKELAKDYDKSENDLKALQSVGQVNNKLFLLLLLYLSKLYACYNY